MLKTPYFEQTYGQKQRIQALECQYGNASAAAPIAVNNNKRVPKLKGKAKAPRPLTRVKPVVDAAGSQSEHARAVVSGIAQQQADGLEQRDVIVSIQRDTLRMKKSRMKQQRQQLRQMDAVPFDVPAADQQQQQSVEAGEKAAWPRRLRSRPARAAAQLPAAHTSTQSSAEIAQEPVPDARTSTHARGRREFHGSRAEAHVIEHAEFVCLDSYKEFA